MQASNRPQGGSWRVARDPPDRGPGPIPVIARQCAHCRGNPPAGGTLDGQRRNPARPRGETMPLFFCLSKRKEAKRKRHPGEGLPRDPFPRKGSPGPSPVALGPTRALPRLGWSLVRLAAPRPPTLARRVVNFTRPSCHPERSAAESRDLVWQSRNPGERRGKGFPGSRLEPQRNPIHDKHTIKGETQWT